MKDGMQVKTLNLEDAQKEIVDEFGIIDEWMDRYSYLIDLGKKLAPLDDKLKTEEHLIRGCQSRVWVVPEMKDGRIYFFADSDAMITKGIIALLVRVLSGRTPAEIINADLHFIDDIGLKENLSPTRSNGLVNMIRQMKQYALEHK
ncbi:SufE family protein [Thiohalophilus sp.]|uniref:SufE family protein n=1 Tax=Thiohalophilus sp. TaxID=3028392 RepID=UPI002ACF0967|nr:SufE family protein [Thiohalophilus sp.]MDZ7663554.1 SufE family protein [Thiohalophilus sp.]